MFVPVLAACYLSLVLMNPELQTDGIIALFAPSLQACIRFGNETEVMATSASHGGLGGPVRRSNEPNRRVQAASHATMP